MTVVETSGTGSAAAVAWWREPTREQRHAWVAAWLGWTLDAFDFTIFLLIMLPIAQEFHVSLTAVTAVFALTLWAAERLVFPFEPILGLDGGPIGRRWAMIVPALIGIPCTPLYLLTSNYTLIVVFFGLQGLFAAGGIYGQNPSYLAERFPIEVQATATGFCYHQGAIFGGLVGPTLAHLATSLNMGFGVPMLIGTLGLISFIAALLVGPETRGKQIVAELSVA